ncbi:hypothetical protein [Massilia alkalitolerans]|uniref:hypothetical protein n=1 Tax=Massilia alkalitolerans TaxID=286638 RepID=UPI0028A7B2D9|nr:hypothetical protein [Massilia alkalitolerans]
MPDINTTQMRDALAWTTNEQRPEVEVSSNPWEWFWQAVQGDFNENRSTGQIVADAAISMIPLVDQICDVRDLIANCKKLHQDTSDTWAWVALALTLIGLVPFLGSFVKGVLKIFFAFIRRAGGNAIISAVDKAITWVVALLRRRVFQKYLREHKIDDVFSWLANEIKKVKSKTSATELIKAFDSAIATLRQLSDKVSNIPVVGPKASQAVEQVMWVRSRATEGIAKVNLTIDAIFDAVILRLLDETALSKKAIVNLKNVHYRGALPEATAVTLMRRPRPCPKWLNEGNKRRWSEANPEDLSEELAKRVKDDWPNLNEQNIRSFHKLTADEIKGPARLIRILSPNSRAMSDCWLSEKVFNDIQNSPDPRAAWRKYLAVWPDWNVNGQFVVYDVKPGETLKVWRSPASSQRKDSLPDRHLEGGWEQIVFNVERSDRRNDIMRYYKKNDKNTMQESISQSEFLKLPKSEQEEYLGIRQKITHPNISGPFETGWGYTDFDGTGFPDKIGLPALPGQLTSFKP